MQESFFPDGLSIRERRAAYEIKRIEQQMSPYENVYWFARALVSSEYGSVGSDNAKMLSLAQAIDTFLSVPEPDLVTSKQAAWNLMRKFHRSDTKAADRVEKLIDFLDPLITSIQDLIVLKFTIEHILIPTNELLRRVPSQYCSIVLRIMDIRRESGIMGENKPGGA